MAETLLGPVDFVVVELPTERASGAGLETLADLADADVIRILDVEILVPAGEGGLERLDRADVGDDALLQRFSDAYAGLLDEEDLSLLVESIAPGHACIVVVLESSWVATLDSQLQAHGARVSATGAVDTEDLDAALDD